jgi:hypothetical protein
MKSATVLLFLAASSALGQGMFQNLDFEQTTVLQTSQTNNVSALDGLPGWTVYASTNQLTFVGFNNACLSATCVSLLGTNGDPVFGYRSFDGGFSVLLQGGLSGSGPNQYPSAASIRQTGVVPATARSMVFEARPDIGFLSVLVDGASVPYSTLSNSPNYTLFGADVSKFAGETVELQFSVTRQSGTPQSSWILDSIQFSDLAIPEPRAIPLLLLGGATLWARHRRQKR